MTRTSIGVGLLAATLALALALATAACADRRAEEAAAITGGDVDRGRDELRAKGCGSCHTIPGVPGATALAGPPLAGIALRGYLAGALPNTPANMERWLRHPEDVKPHTAMPDVGLTDADARDMTAYLYTLR